MECVEKLIKKDMIDPVTGDKLKEKDIIPIQRVCIREIMFDKCTKSGFNPLYVNPSGWTHFNTFFIQFFKPKLILPNYVQYIIFY